MKTILVIIGLLLLATTVAYANGGLAIPKQVRLHMISQDEATAYQQLPAGTDLESGVRATSIALLWVGFTVAGVALVLFVALFRDLLREFPQLFREFFLGHHRH